ncbi:peptide ABC transporter substrate-binding protein [Gorillibacterium massiliense]|uniref:peptide ABC transporter substrate-binding protein n=1 Tax=Gorillibacterium massiliense TaxID=1280390 RepID=UPI0004BA0475|nr:peptide ABC transporter substrate-binding protein [Gorillibacterium massiliense]
MKIKRILAPLTIVALAGSVFAGCSTTKDKSEASSSPAPSTSAAAGSTAPVADGKPGEITTYINGEIASLDPQLAKDSSSSWVLDHVFEGLYYQDTNGLKEGQAASYKLSDDKLTYTFTLKDNLKWSNGDPVVAGDFVYAWKHALDPNTASEYAYIVGDYIEGGQAYYTADPAKDDLKALADKVGVKALDDKTLEVKLVAPTPYFPQLTSFYTYYPVDQKVAEANKDWAKDASTYVSNGPFKLTKWGKDTEAVAEKSDTYYDAASISTTKITWFNITDDNTAWQMYTNGEMNYFHSVVPDGIDVAKANGELKIYPQLATYFYRFNVTAKPFDNAKIRKALAMSINRQAIIDNITKANQTPAYALTGPGILMGEDGHDYRLNAPTVAYFKEDIDEAKKLLADGLKEEGMSAWPKVTLTYNTSEGHKKIAEAIQEMWKKNLGIDVTLENVEGKVWLDRQSKLDYQIMRTGWIGDYLDPMTYIDMFVTGGGNNNTGWSNKEYDKLVDAARVEADQTKREKDFHDAEKILMDEMPIMPIYFYTTADAQKPEVQGVFVPANRNAIFRHVTLK